MLSLKMEVGARNGSAVACDDRISDREALKVKEWEVWMLQDEVAASQGIKIRRRPLTEPPLHYMGPFESRVQNEGNTSRDVLGDIVWYKDLEVSQMKESKQLSMLKNMVDNAPPTRGFVGALKATYLRTGVLGLIAEVKKASPSRGVLRENFDPVEVTKAYEKGRAACLSVLTDHKFFQGGFENLEAIRSSGVQCPLLCKEFVVDAWQIYYARVKGADAILLIAAVLSDLEIEYMIKLCKSLGLAALIEVHDEREMDRVLEIDGIEFVGINNRDLDELHACIITCGSLCPRLNTVIKEIVHSLEYMYEVTKVLGNDGGYRGFYAKNTITLTQKLANDIHKCGGTILGTSRGGHDTMKIADSIQDREINQVYIIGGDGTLN